jgi:ferredoxin-NADP reductase
MPAVADIDPGAGVRAFGLAVDLYARVFATGPAAGLLSRPDPVRRSGYDLRLRLDRVQAEAEDVVSLTFADERGAQLPVWRPGAHLDVFLPSGRLRQYSLCGDPADRHRYRIAVRHIHDGNGGSREVHEDLHEGDLLRVRGPRNAFRLVDAPSYLFIAGGIGITPILPMAQAASRRGVRWRVVYLGRSRASMPFLPELDAFAGGRVELHCDEEHGFADLATIVGDGPGGADLYVCGPPALMDTARQLIRAADPMLPVFSERFSAAPVLGGRSFEIELARTGRTVSVAADETALSAIRRELPGVVYSCQQGFCRTCKCRVLDGDVEHRDNGTLLDSERADQMLICVSRAAGDRLVLDL